MPEGVVHFVPTQQSRCRFVGQPRDFLAQTQRPFMQPYPPGRPPSAESARRRLPSRVSHGSCGETGRSCSGRSTGPSRPSGCPASLLKPLVRRVRRRQCLRIVRLLRSTSDVLISSRFGKPMISSFSDLAVRLFPMGLGRCISRAAQLE